MSEWIVFLAIAFGGFAFPAIIYYYAYKGIKKRDQERIETVIKETEDLDEEVLGRIRVLSLPKFSPLGEMPLTHEILVLTPNRVIGDRISKETAKRGGPSIDWTDKRLIIPKSEITRVWLNKFGWRGRKVKLNILTSGKEYEWIGSGLVLPDGWKTDVKLEDYENILGQVFPDKLSVKK